MQHTVSQSLAACAAILLTLTSIGTIVTVPSAHAQTADMSVELA